MQQLLFKLYHAFLYNYMFCKTVYTVCCADRMHFCFVHHAQCMSKHLPPFTLDHENQSSTHSFSKKRVEPQKFRAKLLI